MDQTFNTSLDSVRTLRRYWETLRSQLPPGRLVPARATIDPKDIGDDLESTFILERVAPGHARFRVTGQNIIDLLGGEHRGAPWGGLFDGSSRSEMAARLETVFAGPGILTLDMEAFRPGADGRAPRMRCILLPLSSDAGPISRVIGRMAGTWPMDGRAARFRILRASFERVSVTPGAGRSPGALAPRGDVHRRPATQSLPEASRTPGHAGRPASTSAPNVTPLPTARQAAAPVGAPTAVPWLRVIEGGLSMPASEIEGGAG